MKSILIVFLGGGLGSIFRYLINLLIKNPEGQFPINTFFSKYDWIISNRNYIWLFK